MKWNSFHSDYFGLFFVQSNACTVIDFTYMKVLNKYIEIIYRNRSKVCRCTSWQWYQLCVCSIRNGPAARNTHIMTQMVTNNVAVWGADADAICSNINTFDNVTLLTYSDRKYWSINVYYNQWIFFFELLRKMTDHNDLQK